MYGPPPDFKGEAAAKSPGHNDHPQMLVLVYRSVTSLFRSTCSYSPAAAATIAYRLPASATYGVTAATLCGHSSSVGCQVLSGLYSSISFTILRESGPRSFW